MTSLLSSSLYVDDLAGGVFHENETVDLYHKVQGIMKEGGFSLRKWNSNCQSFRERIKQSEECSQSTVEAPPKATTALKFSSKKTRHVQKIMSRKRNNL